MQTNLTFVQYNRSNKRSDIMKIFFKIWNILMFIIVGGPAGILFFKAFGFGSLSGTIGITSDFDVLIASLSLSLVLITLILAILGLKGDYGKCLINAFVVIILDLVIMLLTHNIVFAIVQIIMLALYILLAKILQKNL